MKIQMKPAQGAPDGWLARLFLAGIKGTFRPERFGRVAWLFKKSGEAVKLMQGPHNTLTTRLDGLTDTQHKIVAAVIASGVATIHATSGAGKANAHEQAARV